MREKGRPVVKPLRGAVIQLILKPFLGLPNLRNDHSVRSALFFDFLRRSAVGARLLKFSNRFTAYSTYPIELNLGRMILDISLHNRYEQDILGAGRRA